MKAMRFYEAGKPLKLEDLPKPTISSNEVLINVKAVGICGSDIHIIHGETSTPTPIILGHEIAGVISEVGNNVKTFNVGDRVCVDSIIFCGNCVNCMSGRDNICRKWALYGIHTDGGMAEYVKVREINCIKLPENVSFEEGAIATDAIATPYHAIKRAKISVSDFVVIYGCGGLGIHAVQLANLCGAKVVAVDVIEERLDLAKKLGAEIAINAKEVDPIKEVMSLTNNVGADVAMEFVGSPITLEKTLNSVRRGGKAVLVGLSGEPLTYDTRKIVRGELDVMGSYAFCKRDIEEVLNLISSRKLDLSYSVTHRFSLEDANLALETLDKKIGNPIRIVITI
jgi:2-desacetyl-2-hydroxyethyl bacteriochlorophyllide A dehydrogenase